MAAAVARPLKPLIVTALKYAVALGLLAFVISRIDREALWQAFHNADPALALAALLILHLAQAASALRMRYYLRRQGVAVTRRMAVQLYYLGMFYNTVLPSGLGGDGYKVYLLKRQSALGVKDGIRVMLSERASGLLVLCWFLLLLLPLSPAYALLPYGGWLVGAGLIAVTAAYRIGVRLLCREAAGVSLGALPYSLAVQGLNLAVGVLLLCALGQERGWAGMLVLFNLAGVLGAVLPISIGGVGIREFTFLYGAPVMDVLPAHGVAFALLWYVVYVVVACFGLCFIRNSHHVLKGLSHGSAHHPDPRPKLQSH